MDYLHSKRFNAKRRTHRIRSTITGSQDRPRLSVYISNYHVSAQIIDDTKGKTLVYVTTAGQKLNGNMTEKASWVGKEVAAKGKKAKLSKVVFDKGRFKYHGRVKALADAARENGLEF